MKALDRPDLLNGSENSTFRGDPETDSSREDEESNQYTPIIDFPNFLLQVLRLKEHRGERDSGILRSVSIPGSQNLITAFSNHTRGRYKESWVVDFINLLVRARILFDQNIVRSSHTGTGQDDYRWVIGHRDSELRSGDVEAGTLLLEHITVLQSMYQVTYTSRTSKKFLFHLLHWLVKTFDEEHPEETSGNFPDLRSFTLVGAEFLDYLQKLAHDDFAATHSELDQGTQVSNYVFNYLDYCLWKMGKGIIAVDATESRDDCETEFSQYLNILKDAVETFRFRYRTSVEHFYPQNPGIDQLIDEDRSLHQNIVDRFGNLCLMTPSDNAKRGNLMPTVKVGHYKAERQTLKFQLMADITKRSQWQKEEIERHGDQMREVLRQAGISLESE